MRQDLWHHLHGWIDQQCHWVSKIAASEGTMCGWVQSHSLVAKALHDEGKVSCEILGKLRKRYGGWA